MNMMVSATAIAAATPAAKALAASPDQKLVDLAAQFMEMLPAHQAARKRCNELWDEFEARKPTRSDVLRYRLGDDVGFPTELFVRQRPLTMVV